MLASPGWWAMRCDLVYQQNAGFFAPLRYVEAPVGSAARFSGSIYALFTSFGDHAPDDRAVITSKRRGRGNNGECPQCYRNLDSGEP
jgi:hypothetical protein